MKKKNSIFLFLIGLVLAIVVTVGTFFGNLGGAWEGGPASAGELFITMGYILFWCILARFACKYKTLLKITLTISLLTLLSCIVRFICMLTNTGFVLGAIFTVFVSVPFYGIRFFASWEVLNGCAFVLALVCLAFTVKQMKKTF